MKKMKQLKKMLSVMLAVVMSLAMMIPVMAAEAPTPQTGSITINSSGNGDTKVTVNDKTFKAYRVLDATIAEGAIKNEDGTAKDGFAYTVPDALKAFYAERFTLDGSASNFDALVTEAIRDLGGNDSKELEDFAKAVLQAAKDAGIQPAEATGANEQVLFRDLPLGYYVVEDEGSATPLSALILDTTTPDATVNIKASQPVIDKEVNKNTSGTGDADWSVSNNQAIGKPVEYRLTSYVPDMRGYKSYQFVMTDILSEGLTFDEETSGQMAIKIEGNDPATLTKGTLDENGKVVNGDYALVVTPEYVGNAATNDAGLKGTKIEIIFADFIQYRELTGNKITVTYQATLNEKAIIGVTGNDNDVSLKYSNKPGETGKDMPDQPGPNDPTGDTPWEKVHTYVTGIEIFKVDGQTKAPLAGAKFKIESAELATVLVDKVSFEEAAEDFAGPKYWKLKDGSYTLTDPATEGISTDKYVVNEDGSYTVYERTTTREAVVTEEKNTYEGTTDATGVLAFDGLKAGEYTITELVAPDGYNMLKDPIKVTITWKEPAANSTECGWEYNGTTVGNRVEIPIDNNTGTELPSTGGIGTTIFYIIGGILVVGAAILLVTKKRMSKEI